ncbi:MAG: hypothetical protein LBD48_12310 [Treponema sp.]|jgi:sec-independent protein translocase protein TatB|nr:hypothetical protein [Treponema sp.]
MFGIGLSEILLVALIIIVVIRPNDMPKFLRTLGRFYGKAKKTYKEIIMVKDRILKEIDDAAKLDEIPKTESPSLPVKPSSPPAAPEPGSGEGGTGKGAEEAP